MLAEYVPQPVKDFYASFPLVTLPEAYSPHRVQAPTTPELWIAPRLEGEEWSSHPRSLRMQLLLRLAGVEGVEWKDWETEKTAPEATLPALYLPEKGLLAFDAIRPWLDEAHPLYPSDAEHHGYPSLATANEALSFGRLIESTLYPAYLASLPTSSNLSQLAVLTPIPAPWWAGLAAPLPMALWGENRRRFDLDGLVREGVSALKALGVRLRAEEVKQGWLLGCPNPTPLDCLVVAHLHVIWKTLPSTSPLRRAIETEQGLQEYARRLLGRLALKGEKLL